MHWRVFIMLSTFAGQYDRDITDVCAPQHTAAFVYFCLTVHSYTITQVSLRMYDDQQSCSM